MSEKLRLSMSMGWTDAGRDTMNQPPARCRHQYWDLGRCIDCFKTANQIEDEKRASQPPAETLDDQMCGRCGHTALWHSNFGSGECQAITGCDCYEFKQAAETGETPREDDMPLDKELELYKKKASDWNAEADRYLAQRDELTVEIVSLREQVKELQDENSSDIIQLVRQVKTRDEQIARLEDINKATAGGWRYETQVLREALEKVQLEIGRAQSTNLAKHAFGHLLDALGIIRAALTSQESTTGKRPWMVPHSWRHPNI